MLYKYNDNFDEDNYLEEYNDNIYNEFNILLNDENSYDKSIDFSYDIKSYNNNEPIKENQLDLLPQEITGNLINFNNNEEKPKMPIISDISNVQTNFITNKTNKTNNKLLIFNITKEKKEKKKTHLGRKRKHDIMHDMGGKHTKFSQDNIARKIKSKLFEYILLLLNTAIKMDNNENENELNGFICSKFLLKIDQDVIKDINTINNKKLLKTKLKDIFYLNNVSLKYINYGLDYNKKIIENIYKYNNIHKKTISILEKTFFECLEHFRGSNYYEELDGLEKNYLNTINEFIKKGKPAEYIDDFKYLVNRYEKYFDEKKPRNCRKFKEYYY